MSGGLPNITLSLNAKTVNNVCCLGISKACLNSFFVLRPARHQCGEGAATLSVVGLKRECDMRKSKKQKIEDILQKVKCLDDVIVIPKENTIELSHKRGHAVKFIFQWLQQQEHFVGYFLDKHDTRSQAVVSIKSNDDAMNFVTAFNILIDLRANKKSD